MAKSKDTVPSLKADRDSLIKAIDELAERNTKLAAQVQALRRHYGDEVVDEIMRKYKEEG